MTGCQRLKAWEEDKRATASINDDRKYKLVYNPGRTPVKKQLILISITHFPLLISSNKPL